MPFGPRPVQILLLSLFDLPSRVRCSASHLLSGSATLLNLSVLMDTNMDTKYVDTIYLTQAVTLPDRELYRL